MAETLPTGAGGMPGPGIKINEAVRRSTPWPATCLYRERVMRKIFLLPLLAFAAMLLLAPGFMNDAVADSGIVIKPNGAKKFAVMPADGFQPEGITINPNNGDVIVGTFFGTINLVRFSSTGNQIAAITILGGPLLGLAYNPADGKIYICSADDLAGGPAASRIRRINPDFTGLVDVADVPFIGAPADRTVGNPDGSSDIIDFGAAGRAPNDLTFADNGDLYYSDSFQGAVFRINDAAACPGTCSTDLISHDPLLATAGFPPFGANGVAIRGDTLFVANTGDDTIMTIDLTGGFPALATVLAHSINGADGIIYDSNKDLLWVAGNQADQVVAVDPDTGRVVAEIGEFLGINPDGSARGLLFPASLAEAANGKILVTNLAAVLIGNGSEPEGDVTKYTVSFINIPEFDD